MSDFRSLRHEYESGTLDAVDGDPMQLFGRWLQAAIDRGVREPNAMALASVGTDGPSCRIVLLKGRDERGLQFFTNYESRKARDLEHDTRAAATLWWPDLERQVRFEGNVARLPEPESDRYFAGRPRPTQLGAWASRPQSGAIPDRATLEHNLAEVERRFADPAEPIPRPPFWGGYLLAPTRIEFWQGREHRLHDRLLCQRSAEGSWTVQRLSP